MVPYRVLVVDDSGFMRKVVSDIIIQDPQFMVVATATNGREAVEAVKEYRPDAVTLDLEMPEMNGLEALQQIMKENPTPVIMLSGISEDHTRETIKALQYGAFDFIYKPTTGGLSNDIQQVAEQLLQKLQIAVLTQRHRLKSADIKPRPKSSPATEEVPAVKADLNTLPKEAVRKARPAPSTPSTKSNNLIKNEPLQKTTEKQAFRPAVSNKSIDTVSSPVEQNKPRNNKSATAAEQVVQRSNDSPNQKRRNRFQQLVAIGTSTGGPRALHEVISSLPGDLPAPVLVVQHMPAKFTKSLAQRLDSFSDLRVVEAAHGERLEAGVVYIAPGGYHMELSGDADGYSVVLTQQPQRNGHRPSVDVLFESLTPFPELKRHAVIMTGMGSDGARGLKLLMESGGVTAIAEAEETCIVYGMPRAAIETGKVSHVSPLQQIAALIVQAVKHD